MHIDIVPNRNSPPAILLRESYREDGKVKKRTLGNLTGLPMEQVDLIRRVLKGERLGPLDDVLEIIGSRHHGHVKAVRLAMDRLGLDTLLASRPSKQRQLILAMLAARVLDPRSKLATTRAFGVTTIPEVFGVEGATEDDLYEALDWLLSRQEAIEKKLAARHLAEGGIVLYDLTSTYFEGTKCSLAKLGYSRDGKKGKLQVNFGLLTDQRGCPVAVSVVEGNTGDPKTLLPQVTKAREQFGIERMVLVGDRGMITQAQVDALRTTGGIDWVTALRSGAIRTLVDTGSLQLGLFDQRDLFEFSHEDYPGERLVACRNEELARRRAKKRKSLLDATCAELDKVRASVGQPRLRSAGAIGVRVGRIINKFKVAKHFKLTLEDSSFEYAIDEDKVAAEAALDGLYVVRSSLDSTAAQTDETVRIYKSLSNVERAFRSIKTVDLEVRPIYHWKAERVRAHIFLCALAYYVEWHMAEAWRSLLFADENQEAKKTRDPVAPAKRSDKADEKRRTKRLEDGSPVHSLRTLFDDLSTIVRNLCRRTNAPSAEADFTLDTRPTPEQQRALNLIADITV